MILLFFVEQLWEMSYFLKSALKVILFVVIPFLLLGKKKFLKLFSLKPKKLRALSFLTGFSILIVVLMTYYILSEFINLGLIAQDLRENVGITAIDFLYISIYLTLFNSIVEEFFFRGFLFFENFGSRKLKYIFSAGLFSIYHIGIFIMWFKWYIFLLALFGLFLGGIIFALLNEKNKTIINGWIVHIFADLAIIFVGYKMFGWI